MNPRYVLLSVFLRLFTDLHITGQHLRIRTRRDRPRRCAWNSELFDDGQWVSALLSALSRSTKWCGGPSERRKVGYFGTLKHVILLGVSRYCNMDFIIFSALIGIALPRIVISYDIMCQWSKNYRKRMETYPETMKINPNTIVDVAIPTWHINGHGDNCKNNFSLSYMPGVGRTCGEDVETSWAHTNALGPSVREMGPGARHETLNDHWNGWNFRKIVNFREHPCFNFPEHRSMTIDRSLISQATQGGTCNARQAS